MVKKIFPLVLVCLLPAFPLLGQDKKEAPAKPKAVSLTTEDGVMLNATYLPGRRGKESVPILMVHGWDGDRSDMGRMAIELQKLGHAVLVPDLRGHGRSTRVSINGEEEVIERDKLRKPQIESVVLDLQACKKFLLAEHNNAKLNIERLCLIGASEGAIFATNFAAFDWNKRQLPAFKIGRDVAALVLLSPPSSFKGVTSKKSATHPAIRKQLAVLIAVGRQDRKNYSSAKRLYSSLEKFRDDKAEPMDQDLFFVDPDTSLEGADLLKGQGLRVAQNIAQFINVRLVRNPDAPEWKKRETPGGAN